MHHFRGHTTVADAWPRAAIALGNFDGLHVGHRQLIARAMASAASSPETSSVVVTFDPHPREVLAGDRSAPVLTPLSRRLELLEDIGVDATVVLPFDVPFSQTEPEQFCRDILHKSLRAQHVVVGYDFRFGHKARGDTAMLAAQGRELGFSCEVVEAVSTNGMPVSSTRVREALASGDVESASELLQRPHDVTGTIVQGARRGRELGYPTANVATDGHFPLPGIYIVVAQILGATPIPWPAVASLGTNPTFTDDGKLVLEVHLFDFDEDIYGQTMRVSFLKRLRGEKKFDSVESLIEQMDNDAQRARNYFSESVV